MSIHYTVLGFDSNPRPLENESPPITSIPGLPPNYNYHCYILRSIQWDGYSSLENDYFHLFYFFRTLLVEQEREVLMYDLGGFLAAAGGNLGLCLGFSCLSVLFMCVDCCKTIFLQLNISK